MSFRRYNLILSLVLFGALLFVAAVNVLADPYGAYPAWHVERVARQSREASNRTSRAELLRHGPWSTVIVGTSRALTGYTPDDPAFAGVKACNVGLPGTNMIELDPLLHYALDHAEPDRIMLALDFLLFSDVRTYSQDFAQSRLSLDRDLLSYHLENLLSARATTATAKSLGAAVLGAKPKFSRLGQAARENPIVPGGYRKAFRDRLRSFFVDPETYAGYRYSGDRLARFREILKTCRERGVQIDVVVNPVHFAQLEAIEQSMLWPVFEQWLKDIADIAESERGERGGESIRLVSFLACVPYGGEPIPAADETRAVMNWWWESSHFKAGLGSLVLNELYGQEVAVAFGVPLTPDNVDTHIERLRELRANWHQDRPEDVRFVREVAHDALGTR